MKIITLILLFIISLNAQSLIILGSRNYITVTAVTGTNLTTSTNQFIYGAYNTVKSDRFSGSQRIAPYMRWWIDSTEVVTNGTFDSDSSGFTSNGNPNTFEWVASGGGFTGAVHIVGDSASDGVQSSFVKVTGVKYRASIDINIISLSGTGVTVAGFDGTPGGLFGEVVSVTGSQTLVYTFNAVRPDNINITLSQNTSGSCEFYFDNISMIAIVDSVQGLVKVFNLNDLIEDTTYNYDCVTVPDGGNASYSDGEDSTFTTALLAPYSENIIQAEPDTVRLQWSDNTTRNANGTAIEQDTSGGSSWVRIDTVAQGIEYLDIYDLILGGVYKFRYVNLGYNNESAYSDIVFVTVTVPSGQFTFEPASLNWVVDSVAAGGGGGSLMPSIAYIDSSTTPGDDTTIVFTHWGSIVEDQVIILLVMNEGGTLQQYGAQPWRRPTDFTYIGEAPGAGQNIAANIGAFYKVATGSESGNFNVDVTTGGELCGWYIVLDDVDVDDVLNIFGTASNVAADSLLVINGVTTDEDNCLVFAVMTTDGADNTKFEYTNSGWAFEDDTRNSASSSFSISGSFALKEQTSAGATGNVTVNIGLVEGNAGVQFAIKGGVGGGGGSSDSSQTVIAINSSFIELIISDTNDVRLPFTLVLPNALPDTVAIGDTISLTITLDKDTSGEFTQITKFITGYLDSELPIYANVLGGETGGGGPDTTAPVAPTNLVVTGFNSGGSTLHNVSWTESVSIDKDSLHLWVTPIGVSEGIYSKLITLIEGTTEYNDTSGEEGDTKWYKITQQDDSLNVSEFSNADSGLIPITVIIPPPNAPDSLAGVSADLAIVLTWNDNSSDEDSFFVYIDGVKDTSVAANVTGYTQTGLANNTFYEFKLSAWNSAGGESPFSNIINVATNDTTTIIGDGDCSDPASDAITVAFNVSATGYQDSIVITWDHADYDSCFDVYIMRAAENACCGNEVGHPCYDSTNVRGDSTWTDYNVNAGSVYDYKLRVKDIAGNVSSWSDADSALVLDATIIDTTAPDAPTNFVATGHFSGGSTWINTSWTESISSDKDSIKLYATAVDDPLGTKSWLLSLAEGTTEYNDTTLEINESRGYYVTQLDDSSNESSASNADSGLVPSSQTIPPPDAPTNLVGVGDTAAIHLTWTRSISPHDSQKIYRDAVLIATLDSVTQAYTDTPLSYNTSYAHYITAIDDDNDTSNASNTVNTTTVDTSTFEFTNWYVDNQAFGGNNGSSWANAWTSIAAISWGSIDPGDFIYISGGTDSTVYNETLAIQANGTSANWITIRNSYDTGHNGRVIIRGLDGTGYGLEINGVPFSNRREYIYIKGIESRNWFMGLYIHGNINVVTVDSVIIDEFFHRGVNCIGWNGEYDTGPDSITFKNMHITTFSGIDNETDGFYVKYSSNIVLRDSYIRISNVSTFNGHSDAVQGGPVEGFKVFNNVLIVDSNALGITYIVGAVNDPGDGQVDSVIIYNNYLYGGGIYNGGTNWATVLNPVHKNAYTRGPGPHVIIHNTIVNKGPSYSAIHEETHYPGGALILNNIIVQFEENTLNEPLGGGSDFFEGHLWQMNFRNGNAPVDSIRNNLLWTEWSTGKFRGQFFDGAVVRSWADWLALGGTGVNGDPLFVQRPGYVPDQGTLTGELQSGSPAINQGADVRAIVEGMGFSYDDINGNPRDSTPDIGAYQYVP